MPGMNESGDATSESNGRMGVPSIDNEIETNPVD
jgi:hypothetical protein